MIQIPIKPISVNEAWKGRRFKTDTYKKFEQDLLMVLPRLTIPDGPLEIYFEFGVSNPAQDWDSPIKQTQDVLQKKYGFDDRRIWKAHVIKILTKKGSEFIRFRIQACEGVVGSVIL